MAWGVRQGILDAETYLPAIERGWKGLLTTIGDDGQVDFVQPIGEEPREFDPNSSEPYGAGAVLGAGAELLRLLDAASDPDEAALLAEAEALAGEAPYLSVLLHYVPLVTKP
jgi:rhamnogalacturonyl hydrolase YesR